ncbi:copper homeostasis protein CutC [Halalkalibacter kiskunsagensis]|uniref:Copper homeostasis protein cutC homolog n=1 Tax=Halalkalibacter kiskunsagensis TaxID=1548599 RepID=A0ABV6KFB1_9BACI
MLEVIVQNKDDAIIAEQAGADRLELVSAIEYGGLTPDISTITQVCSAVSIPVFVMVRPHAKSFFYNEKDSKEIFRTITASKEEGCLGIVFGALDQFKDLDEELVDEVNKRAYPLPITFHRAIDAAVNPLEIYKKLCKYSQIKRVLTSGGSQQAMNGLTVIKKLLDEEKEGNGPIVMPGSGINPSTFQLIHEKIRATEYHVGSGARIGNDFKRPIDPKSIEYIKTGMG